MSTIVKVVNRSYNINVVHNSLLISAFSQILYHSRSLPTTIYSWSSSSNHHSGFLFENNVSSTWKYCHIAFNIAGEKACVSLNVLVSLTSIFVWRWGFFIFAHAFQLHMSYTLCGLQAFRFCSSWTRYPRRTKIFWFEAVSWNNLMPCAQLYLLKNFSIFVLLFTVTVQMKSAGVLNSV